MRAHSMTMLPRTLMKNSNRHQHLCVNILLRQSQSLHVVTISSAAWLPPQTGCIFCHLKTGSALSTHSNVSGGTTKVVGCLHLTCDASLRSDSSEIADIWLSDNEVFDDCSGADTTLQKVSHLACKQDDVRIIAEFG